MKNLIQPVVGKYILDTLSLGMYNNPLMLYREYVQNSVDAIDKQVNTQSSVDYKIDIIIDGRTRSVKIVDNGVGLTSSEANHLLHDLGQSNKSYKHNRGFRGIGRLGGLGYCDTLIFRTKAAGEDTVTISKWSCVDLRESLNGNFYQAPNDDAAALIRKVVVLDQELTSNKNSHFFEVEMLNVRSPRDILLNIPLMYAYLSQVAPVPFKTKDFKFGDEINDNLKASNIPNYHSYNIFVNGIQVFKPYKNQIPIGRGYNDEITGIEYVTLEHDKKRLAYGWVAESKLSGSINPSSCVDGVRLRSGNILIGDNYTLGHHFKERRFNNYLVGELHITDHHLIPNSRRDDLEDNGSKDQFAISFVRAIGHPYSRRIREASNARSVKIKTDSNKTSVSDAKRVILNGYFSIRQKNSIISVLRKFQKESDNGTIKSLIKKLRESQHIIDKTRGLAPAKKVMLKSISEIIYEKATDKFIAEKIIKKILKEFAAQ